MKLSDMTPTQRESAVKTTLELFPGDISEKLAGIYIEMAYRVQALEIRLSELEDASRTKRR